MSQPCSDCEGCVVFPFNPFDFFIIHDILVTVTVVVVVVHKLPYDFLKWEDKTFQETKVKTNKTKPNKE